jgi:hypothetical protein
MRKFLPLTFVVALSFSTTGFAYDLCDLLGFRCGLCSSGCGNECGCACETSCGCESTCGCEAGCGCEPTCGCGSGCGMDGRQFAGQTWGCCEPGGPPVCPCTRPDGTCCQSPCTEGCGGCGDPGCGCEASCGCEPSCGCGSCSSCDTNECCLDGLCFGSCCGRFLGLVDKLCGNGGCNGCSGEMYWNEWHNDPPMCQDPCDCYGNYTGPSHGGGYRAPYEHPYYAGSGTQESPYFVGGKRVPPQYVTGRTPQAPPIAHGGPIRHSQTAANPGHVDQGVTRPRQAMNSMRPPMRGQLTRKPTVGRNTTYQR